MKRIVFYAAILFLALMAISCENTVSIMAPASEQKDEYVLNCVFNANLYNQVVTITKSYFSDVSDPYTNTNDPFVSGAKITMYYKDLKFEFQENKKPRSDTSRYKTPQSYYLARTTPFKGGDSVSIVATLANGIVLKSAVRVPVNPVTVKNITYLTTSRTTTTGRNIFVTWNLDANQSKMYYPKFVINYQKRVNGVLQPTEYQKEIPSNYVFDGKNWNPYYWGLMRHNDISFDFDAVDSALVSICPDFGQRINYKITSATIKLMVIDEYIASYYSTNNGYMDDVTIRVDEPDYSNVSGAHGIFGCLITYNTTVYVEREYVNQLGFYVDPI